MTNGIDADALASSSYTASTTKGFKILHQALPSLPSVYLTSAHDQISQAFPLCICILQARGGNGLGTRLYLRWGGTEDM